MDIPDFISAAILTIIGIVIAELFIHHIKEKIFGSIETEQYEWIQRRIDEGKFFNVSHVLQESIKLLQKHHNGT